VLIRLGIKPGRAIKAKNRAKLQKSFCIKPEAPNPPLPNSVITSVAVSAALPLQQDIFLLFANSISEAVWAAIPTDVYGSAIHKIQKLCGKMTCTHDLSISID